MLYQLAICARPGSLASRCSYAAVERKRHCAAQQLGVTVDDIEEFVSRAGRPAGPPWTEEHRRAYAAGIAALGAHARGRLRIQKP